MMPKIHFLKGDITEMDVDAIVNPANTDLVLGSGVASAILAKGGPAVQEDCDRLAPVALGAAVVTTGGRLKALYVIHAASMRLGGRTSAESLQLAFRESLQRAEERGLKSIAVPAIGTGAAGFPIEECARILLGETLEHLKSRTSLEHIYFVLYDEQALHTFEETYRRLSARPTAI
ncbi:MAG TPA: macro domain-containing protein [Terriglobia bacterium]|nr:macro domain-containing protein [Terriglobia bacterium]